MAKTLFISYSHDNEEHKAWVKKFVDDLESLGDFEILLDQNMPKGYPLTRFMENGIANADKVLVIGTPKYKEKAESGKGVAYEGSIISTEMLQDIDTTKYYPILRSGTFETSFPTILQGRNGDDITDDKKYFETLEKIANGILYERPIPSSLRQTTRHSSIEQINVDDALQLKRKEALEPIIKGKVQKISRCIRDILLEFSRDTDYKLDIRDSTNTEAILMSKDWFSIVPLIHRYQKVDITYLRYMERCGVNMKSQISDLVIKYHSEMTASQLVELENLSNSQFFQTVDIICSMPDSSIADSGYASLIREFREMQEQYLKVEKEFGIG